MCTAISYNPHAHYFGRNLDLEYHYHESITISPRNFPFDFRYANPTHQHFAIIGVATVDKNYPLYYDAVNEHGLAIAGLNFPGNAYYFPVSDSKTNIASYEFIPWILTQCKTVKEACRLLEATLIVDIAYSDKFPNTPLHWLMADKSDCVTIEQTKDGLTIYENNIGVLTNNPPFPYHTENLRHYLNLTPYEPECRFSQKHLITLNGHGFGAIGLPGDLSSPSRFIRAAFIKENSHCQEDEISAVVQFFHILKSVEQQEGCVRLKNGYEKTIYSSCCNTQEGIYYYTTYENSQITAIKLQNEDIDAEKLISYPLVRIPHVAYVNEKHGS